MKDNQEITPKYWVGHNKRLDDIYLCTADKTKFEVCKNMEQMFGEDWFLDDDFDVILIEVKQVDL